jgi:hypothetical protein
MKYRFYCEVTGLIHQAKVYSNNLEDAKLSDLAARMNAPPGHLPIAGTYDHDTQRVDLQTRQVVPHKPARPSEDHEWHTDVGRWHLKNEVAERERLHLDVRRQIAELEATSPRLLRQAQLGHPGAQEALARLDQQINQLTQILEAG